MKLASTETRHGPRPLSRLGTCGLLAATMCSLGCPSRTLYITQDDVINWCGQLNRRNPTGEPLEVTIVCVYHKDLDKPENHGLAPGGVLTCKDWYEHRPVRGAGGDRFVLKPEQIYLLTNDPEGFGVKLGPALNGARVDEKKTILVKGIRFRGKELFHKKSAIYVFPKFIGADKQVLPVKPAIFSPPGNRTSRLYVTIGGDKNRRETCGQYIEVSTKSGRE